MASSGLKVSNGLKRLQIAKGVLSRHPQSPQSGRSSQIKKFELQQYLDGLGDLGGHRGHGAGGPQNIVE